MIVTEATTAAALAGFVRGLPDCHTPEAALRQTLTTALALTAAAAGVAWAAGVEPVVAPVADTELLALARNADGAAAAGICRVPLGAAGGLALRVSEPLGAPQAAALTTLAAAAGYTLQLLLGVRRSDSRLAELGMLYEIATAMGATLDFAALLRTIVERTQQALRSEACTLMRLDRAHDTLIFEIPTGAAGSALHQWRVPLSQGICGWVARTGRPALVNDPRSDARFDQQVDANSGFQTRNALAVPLLVRGEVSGVLEVLNKQGREPYTDHDLALLTSLAGQAAVTLDNAELYRSLQDEHERLLAAEAEVRKELARDLHDGPAQRLAAIVMQIQILRKLLERDPSRLPAELDSLEGLARKANREVRTMQFQLRPIMLETRGLRAAIEYYVNQLRETERIEFSCEAHGCSGRLDPMIEQAAFGVVQEALGNIRKHAQARHAAVRLREEPGHWIVTISDDGRGFDVAAVLAAYETRGSLGLINMRERGAAVGGRFALESVAGAGTTVTLEIPSTNAQMEPAEGSAPTGLLRA